VRGVTIARVFYTWQSDLPKVTNRNLIEKAIDKAVKEASAELAISARPDKDTQGLTGSPDIVASVLAKIETASVVVADVTPINVSKAAKERRPTGALRRKNGDRPTPNPNVLVELGYAVRCVGWDHVILVLNTAYGARVEDLPFDIRHRSCLQYNSHPTDPDQGEQRGGLIDLLVKKVIAALRSDEPPPGAYPVDLKLSHRLERVADGHEYYQLDYELVNRGNAPLEKWLVTIEVPREIVPSHINFFSGHRTYLENGRDRFNFASSDSALKTTGLRPDEKENRGFPIWLSRDLWSVVRTMKVVVRVYVNNAIAREMTRTFAELMPDYQPIEAR
jgi:hypothetical protein